MTDTILKAVNDQIRAEFQSAYQYLAMAAHFDTLGLKGFAHWMRLQWQEETAHAMKFYDFLLRRDGTVKLEALNEPVVDFEKPVEAFEQVLDQEQHITQRINELYELAAREHDYPLQTLLHWFIDEQVEEEDSVRDIIAKLHLIGASGPSLYSLDRQLGQRGAR